MLDCKFRTKQGVRTCYLPATKYLGIVGSSLNIYAERLRQVLRQNADLRKQVQHLKATVTCNTTALASLHTSQEKLDHDVQELQQTQSDQAQSIAQLRKLLGIMRKLSGRINVIRNRLERCERLPAQRARRGHRRRHEGNSSLDCFDLDFIEEEEEDEDWL